MTLLLLVLAPLATHGELVVAVPNNVYAVEGNTSWNYPFAVRWRSTLRFQQVYAASQFTGLGSNASGDRTNFIAAITNGGWISGLYCRADGFSPVYSAIVSNVEIRLSTTQRSPDGLSPVFSDNVGPDDTEVFLGSFTLVNPSASTAPEVWGLNNIPLRTNFWYDPRRGNLLMDVRVYHGVDSLTPPLDAQVQTSDSVSTVWAQSVDATNGTVGAAGLVTFFAIAPPPIIRVGVSSNTVVLSWFTQPTGFVLQRSTSPGANSPWQTIPGTGTTNIETEVYQIPLNGAPAALFFRLARPGD